MRKMEADAGILHPFLTFPISEPPHGCLSPSASETGAGKNSKHNHLKLMKPKRGSSQFEVFFIAKVQFFKVVFPSSANTVL